MEYCARYVEEDGSVTYVYASGQVMVNLKIPTKSKDEINKLIDDRELCEFLQNAEAEVKIF